MSIKCPLCTESSDLITTLLHLHVHCINAHPNEFCTCPWCAVPFISIRALKDHAKKCSAFDKNEVSFSKIADECRQIFTYSLNLLQSREGEIHPLLVNGNQCLVCTLNFPSNEVAIAHYKEQHLFFSYICVECQQYFQQKSALDDHRATWHALPIKTTSASKRSVNSLAPTRSEPTKRSSAPTAFAPNVSATLNWRIGKKTNLISRNSTYGEKSRFMKGFNEKHCVDCGINFPDTPTISQHFRTEHQMEVFTCAKCNKAYMNEVSVHRHSLHCTKNGAARALSTKKKIKIKTNASELMPVKTNNNILIKYFNQKRCLDCKKQFVNKNDTAEHFKSKHGIKILLCGICQKGFLSPLSLKYHRKSHHNIRAVSIISKFRSF